jgi:hypothetical protein
MKHIKDEVERGHEVMYYEDEVTQLITVDIREDDFDGEILKGYSDFATIDDAQRAAHAFIDGYRYEKGFA